MHENEIQEVPEESRRVPYLQPRLQNDQPKSEFPYIEKRSPNTPNVLLRDSDGVGIVVFFVHFNQR